VFCRVTVVAPRTRIDVALPADVAVADLMPMLLEMAREVSPDGGSRHGGWCLAKLGAGEFEPGRTLSSIGVVDGDLLQLRKRTENPPPPLFDDVVDAIAVSTPDSYRPWTAATARAVGQLVGGLALLLAAVALLLAGPGLVPAVTAGVAAIALLVVGGIVARVFADTGTGVLVAAGSLPMAFVCGLFVVPATRGAPSGLAGSLDRPNLLLASCLVLAVAVAAIMLLATGITAFVATGTAALLGAIAALVATLVAAPLGGIAAGAAAVALALLSVLPRLTIMLARLPLPQVPSNAEDLREDDGLPDYAAIERRAGLAHDYMTGMIIGCGTIAALSAVIAAASGELSGALLGVVVTAVLLLRGRTYANGSQAIALLSAGLTAATGLAAGWLVRSDPQQRELLVFGALLLLGVLGLMLGVVFPQRRFSPVLRRAVDVSEAVLIASVLPLALWVMGLYQAVRRG
jgi:type VII secretion integral membrane protein EccD